MYLHMLTNLRLGIPIRPARIAGVIVIQALYLLQDRSQRLFPLVNIGRLDVLSDAIRAGLSNIKLNGVIIVAPILCDSVSESVDHINHPL